MAERFAATGSVAATPAAPAAGPPWASAAEVGPPSGFEAGAQLVQHAARLLELARQLLHGIHALFGGTHGGLGDGHGARHGLGVRVRKRDGQLAHAQFARHFLRAPGKHHVGPALRRASHLYVAHADASRKACAQRLDHGLLRGEPRGEMHFGRRLVQAVGAFLVRIHLAREAGRAFQDALHARDVHDVHSQAHGPVDALAHSHVLLLQSNHRFLSVSEGRRGASNS